MPPVPGENPIGRTVLIQTQDVKDEDLGWFLFVSKVNQVNTS